MPYRHCARVCTLSAFVVLASAVGFAADGATESVYYYNGQRKVRLALALDELWAGTSLSRGRVERVAVSRDRDELTKRAVTGTETRRAVLYSGDASVRRAQDRHIVTGRLSLKVAPGESIQDILDDYRLTLVRAVGYSPDTYIVSAPGKEILRAVHVANDLFESRRVVWATPLVASAYRTKYIPNDPLFADQWHLLNDGTQVPGSVIGEDINAPAAWDTVRGLGVNIGIVDDGIDLTHPDLDDNVRTDVDWDYIDNDGDPSPGSGFDDADFHGTSVAGVAAAEADNSIGGSGVAPEAKIIGVRMVTADWAYLTDDMIAGAMLHQATPANSADAIHVSNNSWGVPDDGVSAEGFGPLSAAAVASGVANGRGGKGIVYVWAGGNGFGTPYPDNVNYDGFANSIYTIAVGATDPNGVSSSYSEVGACVLVCAPAGDSSLGHGLVTTDVSGIDGYVDGDYVSDFAGTSGAAPVVTGVVALMLEANPDLGWRDVQQIFVDTSAKVDPTHSGWQLNGASHDFHPYFGFGRVDAAAAVTAAASWLNLPAPATPLTGSNTTPVGVPDNNATGVTSSIDITAPAGFTVEHVEFSVDVSHGYRGDLEFELTAPSGMVSVVPRRDDDYEADLDWTFTSVAHWDEDPDGTWTLRVMDLDPTVSGTLNEWSLTIHGHEPDQPPTVGAIADAIMLPGVTAAPIWFTVSDPDTSIALVTATATSSNQTVITDANIVVAGTGSDRTITITPEAGQDSVVTITVTADDGRTTGSTTFEVDVDPSAPVVEFAAATANGLESFASPTAEVTLSTYPGSNVTVGYEVTSGTAIGSGTDYTLDAGTVTFTSAASEFISITIAEDDRDELDEYLTVSLTTSSTSVIGATSTHTYTINDNDPEPEITVSTSAATVNEGDGTYDLVLNIDVPSNLPVNAQFTVTDTETTSGSDYVLENGSATFPAGLLQTTISVPITDDAVEEDDETFEITLHTPTYATLGAADSVVITISASDLVAPTVGTIADQTILANVASAPIHVPVDDGNTTLSALTVTATSSDQTLVLDANLVDGGTDGNRTLVITPEAGQTGTATITVTVSDGIQTDATTFTLTVATGIPTASFVSATSADAEAVIAPEVDVQLSAAPGTTVTIAYLVIGGDATGGGTDYTLAAGTLTFGATETTQTIVLDVLNDSGDEPDETVLIALTSSTNAAIGTTWTHTYTIQDDDLPPLPPGNSGVSCAAGSAAGPASLLAALMGLAVLLCMRSMRSMRRAIVERR